MNPSNLALLTTSDVAVPLPLIVAPQGHRPALRSGPKTRDRSVAVSADSVVRRRPSPEPSPPHGRLRGRVASLRLWRPGPGRSAHVLSTYERTAARYDRLWRPLWLRVAGGSAETAMLAAVVGAVSATDRPRVLDVGAGTGALSRRLALALPGVRPILVDLSPAMLARAADLHDPRAVASVLALPFADGTFDAVASAWVIETVDSPRAAVAEMLRVLRPGGALVYSFCSRPAHRLDQWRSLPTRGVVHAFFAGHFLRNEQTPFHDCDTSQRNTFAAGAATVIMLGKCCTIQAAAAAPPSRQGRTADSPVAECTLPRPRHWWRLGPRERAGDRQDLRCGEQRLHQPVRRTRS